MSRRTRILLVAAGVAALCLVVAASALANAFSQVYQSYRKAGHVDPCRFSVAVLNQAKAQVPPDIDQYAPDFPAALDAALAARARGACGKPAPQAATPAAVPAAPAAPSAPPPSSAASNAPAAGSASPTPIPTAAAAPAAPASLVVAGHTTSSGGGAPAAIIALAALAGLLALAAGLWGLARWRGWDPPWLESFGHSVSEAGVRAEATWAEFADWVRLGR